MRLKSTNFHMYKLHPEISRQKLAAYCVGEKLWLLKVEHMQIRAFRKPFKSRFHESSTGLAWSSFDRDIKITGNLTVTSDTVI